METRPRISLTLSPADKAAEQACKIILIVTWCFAVYAYMQLPAIIPTHFTVGGQANSYGSRGTIFILPLTGTLLYFGLTQLNRYPHIFNYMVKITMQNAERQYTIATRLLRYIKLVILLLFLLIMLLIYLTTIGARKGLGFWLIPVIEILLITPLIIAIIKSVKKP